jgi:lysozyme
MSDLAEQLIEESEGLQLTAYKDTRGLWTVGWGHLLDQSKDWGGYTITREFADALLEADMVAARHYAALFPHFAELDEVRQAVLISMCYQMGAKPLHWPNFVAALTVPDYTAASFAGLDSLWAEQTPQRAKREMQMLMTGDFNA